MIHLQMRHAEPVRHDDSFGLIWLLIVCCLPTVAIGLVLVAAGGVSAGLLIPALTCGAMIGTLMFQTLREPPRQ